MQRADVSERPATATKIFCVGFNKTGTTTLHRVFADQLQYRSAHNPKWTDWSIARNREELDRHDVFSDGGCPSIRNLDELYPDARFILNTRPLLQWVLSRHKALKRSRVAVQWVLRRYLPLGFLAGPINRWLLDDRPQALMRWVRIRNSFHAHVIRYFEHHEGKLLILNIEDPEAPTALANFLGVDQALDPTKANVDGDGSTTQLILNAIGEKVGREASAEVVEEFFSSHGLDEHRDNLTWFEADGFELSWSASDRFLVVLPFLRPAFRHLYARLVSGRSKVRSFFAKWLLDNFIRFFRSERDMDYFTTVGRLGSASK